VYSNITVLEVRRRRREETLGYTLRVNGQKYQSVYKLRTYTLSEFRQLLAQAGCFEIRQVCDLDYDPDKSLALNDDTEEAVFLLQKK
jgi:hypothetical protein